MSEKNGEDRKVVCLGCPSYGELTSGAAVGLYRPSHDPRLDVKILSHQSSLLASNMNALWAWALNTARQGRCDFFAMLHSDVEPGEFWLDTLIAELDAKGLDVLAAVVPIKDQRGVTSTAVAREDGDTWRVRARLTMHEVYRLPETFTSADLPGPLLVNTGCWVCRFEEAWARKVNFTVNDRICFDPKKGVYFPQVEPEDWYVSRLFHELGLKVGATRKLGLEHAGPVRFTNRIPWGTNEHDREYAAVSLLDGLPPCDWFPDYAAGWLTHQEGRELARLAEGKAVLEVGSYCGRSTICLAQKARGVSCVDVFDGSATPLPGATRRRFEENLKRAGVWDKVTVHEGRSEDVLACLPPVYDLAFIDGDHSRRSVARDAELAAALLRPGGLLAFHDFASPNDPGVAEAVGDLVAGGAEIIGRTGSLAVVRPAAFVPISEG